MTTTAPTQAGQQLLRRDYGERVLADLGTQRVITDQLMRATIGEFNPDRVTLTDLYRMRRDPQLKMALYYTKALLSQADRTIKCSDPAIKAGMEEIVDNVFTSTMRVASNRFDFGYQAAVRQYKLGRISATYEDKTDNTVKPVWADPVVQPVLLDHLIPVPPEHARVALKGGRFNGFNTSAAFQGRGFDNTDDPDVPADFAMWFVNEFEEEFRNYYGVSRMLPAYEPWYGYWFTHHMRNRHIEQDADPALQVWYPTGKYTDENGVVRSNRDAALDVGAKLRGGATIAWPSEVYVDEQGKGTPVRLWEAEFLRGGENLTAFNEVLNDLRLEKLRACLIPEETLTEALRGTGSRATSGNRIELFTASMELAASDMDRAWTDKMMRPVVEANWGKDAPPCTMETTGFREEDLTFYQTLIEAAFTADPNALPIKWEALLEKAGVDMLNADEQRERAEAQRKAQEEAQAAADQAAANAPPGAQGGAPDATEAIPTGPSPDQLAASQEGRRSGPRKYEREVIHLDRRPVAPDWAQREGARRERNVAAVGERLAGIVRDRYEAAFSAAADAVAELSDEELSLSAAEPSSDTLELAIGDVVSRIVQRVAQAVDRVATRFARPLTGELASIYHASGAAELNRLGLSADSWDVGRDEVQEWARHRAGELIKTIDQTVVEQHVRPFLTAELQKLGVQDPTGVPFGALELAQRMSDKFEGYPVWMSERVVRSEARTGYNLSAADMWERIGVHEVEEYDGLGGKTGQTDEDCLARNGRIVDLDQFRQDNENEHPNGTLGAVPVTANVELRPLEPGILSDHVHASASIYGVTTDGVILSAEEVGRAMAS